MFRCPYNSHRLRHDLPARGLSGARNPSLTRLIMRALMFCLLFAGCASFTPQHNDGADRPGSREIATSFIALHPGGVVYTDEPKSLRWNYEQGLMYEAMFQMWLHTSDSTYLHYIRRGLDAYVEPDGSIRTYSPDEFNIDNIAPGRMLLRATGLWSDARYRKAADLLRAQLRKHPRTSEGGFWHKGIYPHQMWLDGLYMGQPFQAQFARITGEDTLWNDVVRQFRLVVAHLRDSATGLYYHGWDEKRLQRWADPVTGCSPHFWGRSMGWYAMAAVDVLDELPAGHPDRPWMISMFADLAARLLHYRDAKTLLWYQVVDQGDREGNYIEASASAMYVYAFAKGASRGYLDPRFGEAARESFGQIFARLVTRDAQGHVFLQHVCKVAGLGGNPYRDGSFAYYVGEPQRTNDFKGYGPFLLSAIELERISSRTK